ncbi:hypothetical protein E1301_Tti012134 [Triplophysa tibetana]|uniref:Uncharacterized protein n=1 Tax=Triplophysa tibetana TaxID=1572043 RepID=A0A5A9PIZ4_9TELE|nr:hypothetical protein E1301_Tti012134 [Triplophysa tibetana]
MAMLNDLSMLKNTSFGQPAPRHGLRLLWGFAHECVNISNGKMTAKCDPRTGQFGFKHFKNKNEGHTSNGGRLLPVGKLQYYETGNQNQTSFPSCTTSWDNTKKQHKCNIDRIIVSYNTNLKTFQVIYVTQHSSQKRKRKQFDQHHTYCISPDLIKLIQDLELNEFLQKTMDNEESDSLSQDELSVDEENRPLLQNSVSSYPSSETLNGGEPLQQTQKSPQSKPPFANMHSENSCMDCCCIS